MARTVTRCVLSGSFHQDAVGLEKVYLELVTCGCQVLSPHRMEFIERGSEFVRDKAETDTVDIKTIEAHHLMSIRQADFLWIHIKDGYIGVSTAFEIGYALALSVPTFASVKPVDELIGQFITVVPSVFEAMHYLDKR